MEKFQIIQPSTLLAPFVKQYWFLETDDVLQTVTQRVIPTGYISLIFHRGSRLFSTSENNMQPRAFICGQSTGYNDLVQSGKVNMICINFQPHGAKAFFPLPINKINEQVVPVDALETSDLVELEAKLLDTYDNYTCSQLIESFLTKRLYVSKEYNYNRMSAVLQSVNSGETNINALAQISCLSYKQFKRIFAEYIGTNPKDFLRTVRFQRALYTLQMQPGINLTQLAFECGYYDQPHLVKEFKSFSGYTPSEYLSICLPYSDYFS